MACPSCSEIIPDEVDFCPFCGESTKQVAESLMSDEDRAIADRMASIAAANTTAPPADSSLRLPPASGQVVCMMCKVDPPVVGDYCQKCHDKLELGPEQWDMLKQDNSKNMTLVVVMAVLGIILAAIVLIHFLHHH